MTALPLLNQQPPEKPQVGDGEVLDVVDVFYTLQGEGPFAGRPAVFVRLAGCNLQCPRCDTDYTSNRTSMSVPELFQKVKLESRTGRLLVVITGGEPLRQNIAPFIAYVLAHGEPRSQVQIETNGTLISDDLCRLLQLTGPDRVSVVCSPKTRRINQKLLPFITAYKYVLDAKTVNPIDGLPHAVLENGLKPDRPHFGLDGQRVPVYLQPMDTKDTDQNAANVEAAVKSCMAFGYNLSLQIHKIVNLP